MAIPILPTYSAGQILTSDDMNDVSTLGNYQGLFWIKSQTVVRRYSIGDSAPHERCLSFSVR